MQGSFALSPDEGSWILTAFNAAYYTSILCSAWTVTRFGRKRTLIAGLLGFGTCSLLCAFAPNVDMLLILRVLQGAALGCIFVSAILIILVSVPPAKLPVAFLSYSFVSLAASTVGMLLGGVFVQYAEWQDTFAVTGGFALILAIVTAAVVPSDHGKKRLLFDYVGIAIAFVTFFSFQYLVNEGERRDWFGDTGIVFATFVAAASAAMFVGWKLRLSRYPFLNLGMLRKGGFVLGVTCATLLSVAQYSGTILVQFAQTPASAMSPTVAGGLFALRIVGFAAGIPAIGILVISRRINPRVAVTVALLAFCFLTLIHANHMTGTADFSSFVPLALAIGLAQGVANQPLPLFVFGGLELSDLPMGAVIYKMGPLLGTAISGPISQRVIDVCSAQHLSDLAGSVTFANPNVATFLAQNGSVHELASLVMQQSAVLAYDDVTRFFGAVALFIIPILYFIPLPSNK